MIIRQIMIKKIDKLHTCIDFQQHRDPYPNIITPFCLNYISAIFFNDTLSQIFCKKKIEKKIMLLS